MIELGSLNYLCMVDVLERGEDTFVTDGFEDIDWIYISMNCSLWHFAGV